MSKLLDTINSPDDLKKLSIEQLPILASEIRNLMIDTVSKTGGHLGPSLGVVELTIAIHYVFDTPNDKVIWDVGHQSYAHKILTGRRDKFSTLRQYKGISGFPRRDESRFDHFDTGHSSTSISAALGMTKAKKLKKENNKVIAVIGDGSLMSGMAIEGLNHTGDLKRDIIIILNDNEMSISPTVGAFSSYLSRIITDQHYIKFRNEFKSFLKTIPGIGASVYKFVKQAEESFKGFIMPGIFFEELGIRYIGPLQGHRFNHLIDNLRNIKNLSEPILVHVLTVKGKGYEPAEKNPVLFHGIGPFNRETGEVLKNRAGRPSYTKIFAQTLLDLAENDEKIVAITAGMAHGTGLSEFAEKFPQRFYDVGIAEQHAVTFAAGLATEGFHPVVAIYSTFLQRSYDQIIHDVCYQNLPVTFILDRAGIVGEDGVTHQGILDLSYLRSIPNIVIMSPKDENELQHMIKTAISLNKPSAVRFPKGRGYGVPLDTEIKTLTPGKGEIIETGDDLVILAVGSTVYPAIEAAKQLKNNNIHSTVINCRFVKPLDSELILHYARKIGVIITVEENTLTGGFGSAILELMEEKQIFNIKLKRIGINRSFLEHGSQEILRKMVGIDASGIAITAENFLRTLK
ncbi:MAG: 1-deoxy-D-xylulose-5-phosphate synthase [Thermodesulfobacteriota bacterium]|nr:1-deoxy-D-xylulose-5-phosphate synthase [Thermodesulfobacteriota bacterium]